MNFSCLQMYFYLFFDNILNFKLKIRLEKIQINMKFAIFCSGQIISKQFNQFIIA